MLETPLKCCSQKCTFFRRFGTGAKAPVPKKSLKLFQKRLILKNFRNFWTNGPNFKYHTFSETAECQLQHRRLRFASRINVWSAVNGLKHLTHKLKPLLSNVSIAVLTKCWSHNQEVPGSIPGGTNFFLLNFGNTLKVLQNCENQKNMD